MKNIKLLCCIKCIYYYYILLFKIGVKTDIFKSQESTPITKDDTAKHVDTLQVNFVSSKNVLHSKCVN